MQPSAEDIRIGSDTCYTYKYTYSMYILDSQVWKDITPVVYLLLYHYPFNCCWYLRWSVKYTLMAMWMMRDELNDVMSGKWCHRVHCKTCVQSSLLSTTNSFCHLPKKNLLLRNLPASCHGLLPLCYQMWHWGGIGVTAVDTHSSVMICLVTPTSNFVANVLQK